MRQGLSLWTAVAAGAFGAGLVSCGKDGPPDPLEAAPICSSGTLIDPDEQPSEVMAPGRACIGCHVAENTASGDGDAPVFAFAGTVYPTGHEPDDCAGSGAAGAVVEITDARGKTFQAAVNAGGNFALEVPDVARPVTARVTFQGRTRRMDEPPVHGDCNGCHTQAGTTTVPGGRLAPGRIALP